MRHIGISTALAVLLAFGPAHAADPPPFPDFTFKRMKPPKAGTRKRITVQIDPSEQWPPPVAAKPVEPISPADPAPAAKSKAYAWFWDQVPAGGAGNDGLTQALAVLSRPPAGVKAPQYRLDRLRKLADRHGLEILKATIGTRVSPALALAVMAVESAGKVNAVSSAGAQGLMQLMPDTAKRFGVTDSSVPGQNIKGGVAYLDWLMKEFDGDPLLVLAGYNAGEGAVTRHAGVPPYAETRGYVPKVLAAFHTAKGLCLTPPMLVSDGCVFMQASRVASNG
ncbi:lytic transglycosylase domain-containing protein [Maribius pontilimi]|uniref:Lytic transglycosylase domain-containing protein n=1 Tax=Palleronia pontilimi TaxID=1964209 RepID=A0A934IE86_9RHOB|nr:lytic transglycosylase domain-containing protein [Palleronia pontilimi]MBJ3761248.1 lytic transglycosylase domain-containing protein [Palleronia pontilimi]